MMVTVAARKDVTVVCFTALACLCLVIAEVFLLVTNDAPLF